MKLLAIDPSVNNVGWATWTTESKEWDWGLIHPRGRNALQCAESIVASLQTALTFPTTEITDLVVEYPTFFEGTKGAVAAKQGYTIDLGCIAGYLSGRFHTAHTQLYLPSEWKGNIPKTGIEFRFIRIFGELAARHATDHEQEAVMLGRFYLKEKKML